MDLSKYGDETRFLLRFCQTFAIVRPKSIVENCTDTG